MPTSAMTVVEQASSSNFAPFAFVFPVDYYFMGKNENCYATTLADKTSDSYSTQASTSAFSFHPQRFTDDMLLQFLNFLWKDVERHPEHLEPVSSQCVAKMDALVARLPINLDEPIPEDDESIQGLF